jgi:hypothetical protein
MFEVYAYTDCLSERSIIHKPKRGYAATDYAIGWRTEGRYGSLWSVDRADLLRFSRAPVTSAEEEKHKVVLFAYLLYNGDYLDDDLYSAIGEADCLIICDRIYDIDMLKAALSDDDQLAKGPPRPPRKKAR